MSNMINFSLYILIVVIDKDIDNKVDNYIAIYIRKSVIDLTYSFIYIL